MREETRKGNQTTALRFQIGERHQTFLAPFKKKKTDIFD